MKKLTKREIQEELKRLGIHTTSDIKNCFSEYKSYCSSLKEADRSDRKSRKRDKKDLKS